MYIPNCCHTPLTVAITTGRHQVPDGGVCEMLCGPQPGTGPLAELRGDGTGGQAAGGLCASLHPLGRPLRCEGAGKNSIAGICVLICIRSSG